MDRINGFDIMAMVQFYKASQHKNLLSTEKYCLTETGYQPKLHKFTLL